VGKTTIAAALAVAAASRARRVLLCDLDGSGATAQALGIGDVGYEPTEATQGLHVMRMDTAAALHHYLRTFTPMAALGRIRPLGRALDLMGGAAPGVREVLALGRLLWAVRTDEYDLVVMDGPATGHVIAYLDAPRSVGTLASGGLLAGQTGWMSELLADHTRCGVLAVALPEEAPAEECCRLIADVSELGSAGLCGAVINRVPLGVPLASDRALLSAIEARDVELPGASHSALQALARERDSDDAARRWIEVVAGCARPAPFWSVPVVAEADVVASLADVLGAEW